MTRRKDGRWQQSLTVTEHGRRITKFFYGRTKAEVLRKIAAYKEKAPETRSFSAVADEWFEESSPELSYNTVRSYRSALRRAKLWFGSTPLSDIRPVDVRRYVTELARDNHASAKTARMYLTVVSLVFRHALNCGDIDANPAAGVTIPKNLPSAKRELPSDEDLRRVKASTDLPFGMFAFWALYTGCRRGELLALRWEDVDVANRTISVCRSLYFAGGESHVKEPKTLAGTRTVPLLNRLLEKITPGRRGLIFPDPAGGLMRHSSYDRLWKRYAEESGVSSTPHQLRHSYATMLFEADISPKDAQELLGHANLSTTENIYTHIRDQRRAVIAEKLLDVDIA